MIVAAIDLGTYKIAGAIVRRQGEELADVLAFDQEICKPGAMNRGCAGNFYDLTFHLNTLISKLSNEAGVSLQKCFIGYAGQGLLQKKPEYDNATNECIDYLAKKGLSAIRATNSHSALTADYALTQEEKEKGTLFIDFGYGTTSSVVYEGGKIIADNTWPAGTFNIIKDLQSYVTSDIGLQNFPFEKAAKLKELYAINAEGASPKRIRLAKVEGEQEYFIKTDMLDTVINARLNSNLRVLDMLVSKSWFEKPGRSIVICGGGSQMKNLPAILGSRTGASVREADMALYFAASQRAALLAKPEMSSLSALLLAASEDCLAVEAPPKEKAKKSHRPSLRNLISNLFNEDNEKI